MAIRSPETKKDRVVIAEEAGYRRLSPVSVFAGVLAAYGLFALVAAIVAAALQGSDAKTNFSSYNWETVRGVGAAALGLSLFIAYLFGGYVAGRMARRAGIVQAVGVIVLGILLAVAAGFVVNALTDTNTLRDHLHNFGLPTTWHQWRTGVTWAGMAGLAGIVVGSLLGGMLGDRWHSKLMARAANPAYGPDAVTRSGRPVDDREDDRYDDRRDDRDIDLRDREVAEDRPDRTVGTDRAVNDDGVPVTRPVDDGRNVEDVRR
jgi:MFS family permease